jgi:nicotinamide-nucleotide amidase
VIATHGVVSEPVGVAMAEGARAALGVDVAVGLTGSAGPDPQEESVGSVVIAVATPDSTRVRTFRMPGDRERVRTFATTAALQLIRMSLQGIEWGTG